MSWRRRLGRGLADRASRLVSFGLCRSPLLYRLGNLLIGLGLDLEYPQRRGISTRGATFPTNVGYHQRRGPAPPPG